MIDLSLDKRVLIESELDEALQEIDILFNTENTELIGCPSFGVTMEKYLWSLTPMESELEKYIIDTLQSQTTYVMRFRPIVKVEFLQGNYRSVYHVKISLSAGDGKRAVREYQYQ